MKPRLAATIAIVGWFLAVTAVAGCAESDNANKWGLLMPPMTETEQGMKLQLDGPLSSWVEVGNYPSREVCERARANWPCNTANRLQVSNAKCAYIDDLVTWCLSFTEGQTEPKDCANCVHDLVMRGHACVQTFKTEGQCKLGADKFLQDYYVSADRNGELVVVPPEVRCAENGPWVFPQASSAPSPAPR
jgi:hypothetical protein